MKTVSKISLFIVILSGLFVACNKDQKVVKSIGGIWYLEEISTNGNVYYPKIDTICIFYSFNEDKIKKGEVGDGLISVGIAYYINGEWGFQGFNHSFTYKIHEKGTKIELTIEWMKDIVTIEKVETIDADILELTDDRLMISYIAGYDFVLIYNGQVIMKKESGTKIIETFLRRQDKYDTTYEGCYY